MRIRTGKRVVHRFRQAGGGFDRNLIDIENVCRAVMYIKYNPVRRGLAEEPVAWLWSSVRARAGIKDVPITIDAVEFTGKHIRERACKP